MPALLLALALPAAVAAADPLSALESGGEGRVRAVVDGDTVVLERPIDGAGEVRLVGIQAPKLPLGRAGFAEWPLAPEAKAALEELTLGRAVRLFHGGRKVDRHGRLLAHLRNDTGLWVQGEMLGRGLARVYTFPDNRALAAPMWERERTARAARRGIWALPFYAVRDPRGLERDTGTFQVVKGAVLAADEVKGVVYLNFGRDWRRDFTITIDREALRLFRAARVDPLALAGQAVRVRGWVRARNGPLIEATHPEQIEREPDGRGG